MIYHNCEGANSANQVVWKWDDFDQRYAMKDGNFDQIYTNIMY